MVTVLGFGLSSSNENRIMFVWWVESSLLLLPSLIQTGPLIFHHPPSVMRLDSSLGPNDVILSSPSWDAYRAARKGTEKSRRVAAPGSFSFNEERPPACVKRLN